MDETLETSLFFAGKAGDIESLKALARSESRRAKQFQNLLTLALLSWRY
jgi:hypothetical protein